MATSTAQTPTASQAVFDAELVKFDQTFRAADAIRTNPDGSMRIDTTKVPEWIVSAYQRLVEYGYANGLMP